MRVVVAEVALAVVVFVVVKSFMLLLDYQSIITSLKEYAFE